MLSDLLREYKYTFDEEIEHPVFMELSEEEQIKILKDCLEKGQRLFENDYFNNNYMEEVK